MSSAAARGDRLRVEIEQVLSDAKAALQGVLQATPGWGKEAAAAASVERISGALTNLVFRCTSPAADANATVIVRVFGRGGKLFSSRDERDIFLLASELGLGPRCLVEYENGRVEEFLPGDALSCDRMREPAVSAAIAAATAEFNVRMLTKLPVAAESAEAGAAEQQGAALTAGEPQPAIYQRLRQWHATAREVCGDRLKEVGLADLLPELHALESRLAASFPSWVGFCHNDLLNGNILLFTSPAADGSEAVGGTAAGNGGKLTVKLIDYEYSTLNDVAFDVANHFCEWGYNYHSDEPHLYLDSRLPGPEQRLHFCRKYIAAIQQQAATKLPDACASLVASILSADAGKDGAAETAGEAATQLLLRKAEAHMPLAHLMWGVWGLIQDKTSDNDFNYLSFGRERIERYHVTKLGVLHGA
ncbi:putative choline kinase 2 [Chlorella vulgaris]